LAGQVGRRRVGAVAQQQGGDLGEIRGGGVVQGPVAGVVGASGVGAGGEQESGEVAPAGGGGQHQRRPALHALGVGRLAGGEQLLHGRRIAAAHRLDQPAVAALHRGVRGSLEQGEEGDLGHRRRGIPQRRDRRR
jgi:hypothetical protein